ncbi:heme-binding protein [Microbacterium sp. KR10-403]|uniref:heme-binding protein n=1 Tax=Microbacterium sp. KR10-403 TaxID=3158581 RepID=UPI0032E410BC
MPISTDVVFQPLPLGKIIDFPFPTIRNPLGPLALLPGTWTGTGFNTIWRPNHTPGQDRFLELNLTDETLEFTEISGAIPNRGLLQVDINMFGITYMQQISDHNLAAGLHVEPGIWAVVPATSDPDVGPTVVRMASIPHGTTILAQGTSRHFNGPPTIPPTNITPTIGGSPIPFPESNLAVPTAFRSPAPQLVGITQAMVDDPNSVLRDAIAGQTILSTTEITISTKPVPVVGGGTANTAFLVGTANGPNADSTAVTATFWIEKVKGFKGHPDFWQLQYTQQVDLQFAPPSWPHITVATLRKKYDRRLPIWRVNPFEHVHLPHTPAGPVQRHPGPGPVEHRVPGPVEHLSIPHIEGPHLRAAAVRGLAAEQKPDEHVLAPEGVSAQAPRGADAAAAPGALDEKDLVARATEIAQLSEVEESE